MSSTPRRGINFIGINPDYLALILLVVFVVAVMWQTIVPGTWFLGWDSVMSELNFPVSFSRALTGVWQGFQGLGFVGGHGYVSDLIHTAYLWFLNLFVPLHLVRYTFAFSTWFGGGVGVYILVRSLLADITEESKPWIGSMLGILGALLYLLHPYTIQNFYVMHDAFAWYHLGLPWAIYLFMRAFQAEGTRGLVWWFLFSFAFSFIGFIPPVFVGYMVVLGLIGLGLYWQNRNKGSLKRLLVIIGLSLLANSYWLLPVAYFTATQREVYLESKLNQLTTPENNFKSRNFGTLEKIITGEGFYFESLDADSNGNVQWILQPWMDHWSKPAVQATLVSLFWFACLGWIGLLTVYRKERMGAMVLVPLLALSVLTIDTLPFSFFNEFLRMIPVVNQAFRIPFTKFSAVYVFMFSLMVVFGLYLPMYWYRSVRWLRLTVLPAGIGLVLGGIYLIASPVFQGELIYSRLKVYLPSEYERVLRKLNQMPEQRVSIFPLHSYNGWYITNWGYTGSGFLFYGANHAFMDRAFDVWSRENTSFYTEAKWAIANNDADLLATVLKKYDVTSALVDRSLIVPGERVKTIFTQDTEALLVKAGAKEVLRDGWLSLYALPEVAQEVHAPAEYAVAGGVTSLVRRDVLYGDLGTYVSDGQEGLHYPYSDLEREDLSEGLLVSETNMVFERTLPFDSGTFVVPGLQAGMPVTLSVRAERVDGGMLRIAFDPLLSVESEERNDLRLPEIELPVAAVGRLLVSIGDVVVPVEAEGQLQFAQVRMEVGSPIRIGIYDGARGSGFRLDEDFLAGKPGPCWTREGGKPDVQDRLEDGVHFVTVKDASGCMSFKLGTLPTTPVIVRINQPYISVKGSRPHFCLMNETSDACLHDEVFRASSISYDWNTVGRDVVVTEPGIYWLNLVARPPDKKGMEWEIGYKTPQVTVIPQVNSFTIAGNEFWEAVLQGMDAPVKNGSVTVRLPVQPIEVPITGRVLNEAEACDVFRRGTVARQTSNMSLTYQAWRQGAVCDAVYLEEIKRDQHYLMQLGTKTSSGRGIRITLYDGTADENVVETLLTTETPERIFSIPGFGVTTEKEYVLNTEVRSLGRELAESSLTSVRFYPLLTDWISGFTVHKTEGSNFNEIVESDGEKITNPTKVEAVAQFGTGFYTVGIEQGGAGGFIRLAQAYDPGWMAFGAGDFKGIKPLKHTRVDGWANGFYTDDSSRINTIYLVFWPQYLEWFGLTAFIIVFVGLLLRHPFMRR